MKRMYSFFVVLLLMTVLSGCNSNSKEQTKASEPAGQKQEVSKKPEVSNKPTETKKTEETKTPDVPKKSASDYIKTVQIKSSSLANNIVNEPLDRTFYVCLPPSYNDSKKKYPVVYYLHGHSEMPSDFPNVWFPRLFSEFETGAKEFILVCVDGLSNLGGAFYANSPVSGNWEDYVVKDVVSYIDKNYRTIADCKSRGICGFSMGGFGAYNLAFRHPDKFCAVLSMSPGALADNDLASAMESWGVDTSFLIGYGRAFSPKLKDKEKKYANIPTMDHSSADMKIVKQWENGFGNLNKKLDDYLALKTPLKAIKIIYGKADSYEWIPRGCKFLAKCMDKRKIKYEIQSHSLAHAFPIDVIEGQIVPFFDKNLAY